VELKSYANRTKKKGFAMQLFLKLRLILLRYTYVSKREALEGKESSSKLIDKAGSFSNGSLYTAAEW
jgi:hypothetical protein